ncbi:type-F conjugative transfer system pilin assembly protein TraF [Cysteiniphilum marinum]|uniref:type-F conjugative transfer system pilin assembly protein TraF n=1 Tax=Cysteiniphilum marinum TaxID=2774191 RepID=UPI00193B09C5|nr:type-F conjugative transfer system pilin assembly protein TraF [Cysteiniphilum marinum]
MLFAFQRMGSASSMSSMRVCLISFLSFLSSLLFLLFLTTSLAAIFITPQTVSAASYNAMGWQWYSKADEEELARLYAQHKAQESKKKQAKEKNKKIPKAVSYTEQLKAFQAHYEEMQAKATITRKVEDVAYVMYLRMFMMEQSKDYGRSFQKALLKYPNLSYALEFPTQDRARQIGKAQTKQRQTQAIKQYAATHGLFYFYKGRDVYSQELAASVQHFADQYGITLIGIAVDGVMVEAIKENAPHSNQAQQWGVKAVPALFLYDNNSKKVRPFAYGFIAQDEMAERFLQFATNYDQQPLQGDVTHAIN